MGRISHPHIVTAKMNFMNLFQVDLSSDVAWWAFLVLMWFFLAFNTDIFLQRCVCSFFLYLI